MFLPSKFLWPLICWIDLYMSISLFYIEVCIGFNNMSPICVLSIKGLSVRWAFELPHERAECHSYFRGNGEPHRPLPGKHLLPIVFIPKSLWRTTNSRPVKRGFKQICFFTHCTPMCVSTVYSVFSRGLWKKITGILLGWDSNPRPLQF